jgi:HEAT repeat protein
MICPHCSRKNPEEAAFCAGCGKKIADVGAAWATDALISPEAPEPASPPAEEVQPAVVPVAAPEPVRVSAAPVAAPEPVQVSAEPPAPPVERSQAPAATAPVSPKRRIKPTVWVAVAAVLVAVMALGIPPLVRESRFRSNAGALASADAAARADAAAALAASKDARAVPLLVNAMADDEAEVREAAQDGMVSLGSQAVGTYLPLLKGEDPEARAGAIELALRLGDQGAVEPLCELLDGGSADAATRKAAIDALTELCAAGSDIDLLPYLVRAVGDKDEGVRLAAITALRQSQASGGVSSLVTAFRTSTPKTRKAAGEALEAIGGPSVYPLMCCAADPRVSSRAVALVRRIGEGQEVVRAIQNKNAKVRKAAIGVIVGLRYKESSVISALILRLRKDPDVKVRIAAAEALGVFDASGAGDLLFTTLCKGSNKSLRAAAATALVRIWGAKDRALLYALRDRNTATVANLYKRFIRWGKSETLDIMSDAVMEHGYPTMVVDYLNCGSSQLDAAARRWCSNHGYRVITSSGSGYGGPHWGG